MPPPARIGRADTAQFAGPAASVPPDEPNGLRKEEKRGCMPMEMDTTDLIARARAGDHKAFRDLVQGHSHELQAASMNARRTGPPFWQNVQGPFLSREPSASSRPATNDSRCLADMCSTISSRSPSYWLRLNKSRMY